MGESSSIYIGIQIYKALTPPAPPSALRRHGRTWASIIRRGGGGGGLKGGLAGTPLLLRGMAVLIHPLGGGGGLGEGGRGSRGLPPPLPCQNEK